MKCVHIKTTPQSRRKRLDSSPDKGSREVVRKQQKTDPKWGSVLFFSVRASVFSALTAPHTADKKGSFAKMTKKRAKNTPIFIKSAVVFLCI